MFSRVIFGSRLRQIRQKHGDSQAEAAAVVGGTATLISDMEKGRRTTTLDKLVQLAQHYNISADYLLGLTDEPRPLRGEAAGMYAGPTDNER